MKVQKRGRWPAVASRRIENGNLYAQFAALISNCQAGLSTLELYHQRPEMGNIILTLVGVFYAVRSFEFCVPS